MGVLGKKIINFFVPHSFFILTKMVLHFLILLLFFSPAFLANATPVLAMHIPGLKHWNTPVSEKIFGKNKTIRGFVSGIFVAIITGGILFFLGQKFLFFWHFLSWGQMLILGFLMGCGALLGDALESFIKRRMGKKPGSSWPFWDGIDYLVGALIFTLPYFVPSVPEIIFLLLFSPTISLITNTMAYFLGLKKVWY